MAVPGPKFHFVKSFQKKFRKIFVSSPRGFFPEIVRRGWTTPLWGDRDSQTSPHMRLKPNERAAQGRGGPIFRSLGPIWNFSELKAIGHMAQNIP